MTLVRVLDDMQVSPTAALFEGRKHADVVTRGHVVVVAPETPHRYENRGEGTLRQVSIHPSGEVQQTWLETD